MPFTVEDFRDFVQLLEERPQWRTEMRRLVLSDEYLALPEQIAELRRDTERRLGAVEVQIAELRREVVELRRDVERRFNVVDEKIEQLREDVGQLKEDVGQLKEDVGQLKEDVGQLKGENLERRYRERGHGYFGKLVRRTHVLTTNEISALLDDAMDQGVLSRDDVSAIGLADVIVRGRSWADGQPVMALAEVSSVVDRSDVQRAADRAARLAKLGTPVLPVVAGGSTTERADDMARSKRVWQMLNGRVIEPPTDAPANPDRAAPPC